MNVVLLRLFSSSIEVRITPSASEVNVYCNITFIISAVRDMLPFKQTGIGSAGLDPNITIEWKEGN